MIKNEVQKKHKFYNHQNRESKLIEIYYAKMCIIRIHKSKVAVAKYFAYFEYFVELGVLPDSVTRIQQMILILVLLVI